MLIDCDSCVVKGAACGGCVVSVMLGTPPAGVELDEEERRALGVLADVGMVPHLRLVTADGLDLDVSSGVLPTGKGKRRHLRRTA
jgi:hypothetical protein